MYRHTLIATHNHSNHSSLVNHHFTPDAFGIVQEVHFNLRTLKELHNKLPEINLVGNSLFHVTGLKPYLSDISQVATNLNHLTVLSSKIPLLEQLAPRVKAFSDELKEFNNFVKDKETYNETLVQKFQEFFDKTKALSENHEKTIVNLTKMWQEEHQHRTERFTQKNLEHLRTMREETQKHVESFKVIKGYLTKLEDLNKRITHLEASDAVEENLITKTNESYLKAKKAIQLSEKLGNKECVNRQRLGLSPTDNLLTWLNSNTEGKAEVHIKNGVNHGCK